MKPSITASEARQNFSDLVSAVAFGKRHIIVTRQGKNVAALIPAEELVVLEEALEQLEDAHDLALIKADEDREQLSWESVIDELDG